MRLEDVIAAIGDYTDDSVLITEAEPLAAPGPRILWCNAALTRQTGWSRAEIIGRDPRMFQGPDTDPATIRGIGAALRAWRPVRADILNHRKDGAPFWTDLSIRPVADSAGWFRFWVAVQRDVTERKAHELGHRAALEALQRRASREAEVTEQLAGLGRNAPGAIYQSRVERDGRRRLTYWSEMLPKLFGVAPTSTSIGAIMSVVHPADLPGLRDAVRAAQDAMALLNHDYRIRHGVLGERWLRSVGAPRRAADGALIWDGHVIDITDQRRALAELEAARARAEAASEAKSRFLAVMSHELRTPLNGVLGMAALMEAGEIAPVQRDRLRIIRDSGEALMTVLGDMLDFSRTDAEATDLQAAPFALSELARRIDTLHAMKARERDLGFGVGLCAGPGARRMGDIERVLQLAHKLVDNAIKFTGAGSVAVRLLDGDGEDDALVIEVEDSGKGIAAQDQARIFDPFGQIEEGATRGVGGAGMGLTLARRLAEAMGGAITLTSAPGYGSTFRARLPLPRALPEDRAEGASGPTDFAGLAALVVDDHATSRTVLESFLRAEGFEVETAEHGALAVDAFAARRFDIVLMDLSMPVMGGAEALRRMRGIEGRRGGPATPIIAVTAHGLARDARAHLAMGFDDHVAKPVTREALMAHLRHVMRTFPAATPA